MDQLQARERIVLETVDDLPDVVHKTVAAIAQGERVYLETADVRGLLSSGLDPSRRRSPVPPTILLKDPEELPDWIPAVSDLGARLARKAWPGRLSLAFPSPGSPSLFHRLPVDFTLGPNPNGSLAFMTPTDPFLRKVLGLLPGPVFLDPDPAHPIALHIEAEARAGTPSPTLVRIDDATYTILQQGDTPESAVRRMACTVILFICTGNTCRSPMAEAIAKLLLARHLGCTVLDLESRGYLIHSAGITASEGQPAAPNAVEIVRHRGGDLESHKSRRLTLDHVRDADLILPMTEDHRDALLEHVPDASPRTRLLHPEGHDLADPYGSDRATYLETAQLIESCLARHLASLFSSSH